MRMVRTAVLAGAAALCVAGTAMAASNNTHVMKVALADGSVARIVYTGDVAPRVELDPAAALVPVAFTDSFDAAPFAAFDRIFADMDRQAAAMLRQAQALQTQASQIQPVGTRTVDGRMVPDLAAFGDLPAGTVSYRFVSTSDGGHVCTQSWQMTAQGPGQQPKLISASSGDCGAGHSATPAATPVKATTQTAPAEAIPAKVAPARHAAPGTI